MPESAIHERRILVKRQHGILTLLRHGALKLCPLLQEIVMSVRLNKFIANDTIQLGSKLKIRGEKDIKKSLQYHVARNRNHNIIENGLHNGGIVTGRCVRKMSKVRSQQTVLRKFVFKNMKKFQVPRRDVLWIRKVTTERVQRVLERA